VAIAVVGSRSCSHYGREQARRFGVSLAQTGFTVVSGLARGVDIAALQGAMDAGGRTIAVLGNGLASVYPPEHAEAAERIAQNGAVISEIPIDTAAAGENFPSRNRIIAGLSLGVLVVEAAKRSGALITARLANEYNREVFAVPGRVDLKTAMGTNHLIREGQAKLVMGLEDILDELGELGTSISQRLAGQAPKEADETSANVRGRDGWAAEEGLVWDQLSAEFVDIDELIRATGLCAPQVMTALTRLQIRALICTEGGRRFARRAP
jgi:DNA processing protein